LRQAGRHRRFTRHPARPRRLCCGDAGAGIRHSRRQGRGRGGSCGGGGRLEPGGQRLPGGSTGRCGSEDPRRTGARIPHGGDAGGPDAERLPRASPAGPTAGRTGVRGRQPGSHSARHRGVVRLGDAADRILLRRRRRPGEVGADQQGRAGLGPRRAGQSAGPRRSLRHCRTEHGDDVVRHEPGHAARWPSTDDGVRHLWRVHPMMANPVRMTLINSAVNPTAKAFFIMVAAHDGPETGEDGPTHHGLFWMSLFTAYPGIKVMKPLDANEAIEMLFHAAELGEPVVFSVVRPGVPVLKRGNGIPPAREAINGAYVLKPFRASGKPKLVLAVCGGQVMANLLEILPELEELHDVKIIAVTSPQLFEELRKTDPQKADAILSADERPHVVALHNGWRGFLYPFLLPADHAERSFGMDDFLRSGSPKEIYRAAGFDPDGLREKFRKMDR